MNESLSPPPSYEEVIKTKNFDRNWRAWYRKLIALEFNQEEANEYTKLFVTNEIYINMIPELNEAFLTTIGIDKAGHRIRILRLQNKTSIFPTSVRAATVARPVVNVLRCAWHPDKVADKKCNKCNQPVCLNCRQEKIRNGYTLCYCQDCLYNECTIL